MAKPKVMLDPGHWGSAYNPSTVLPGYYESNFTWSYHLLLKDELQKRGIDVFTTRAEKDYDVPVVQRGVLSKGCDLFISLHSNACDSPSVDRVVVIHQLDQTQTFAQKSKRFAEFIAPVVNDCMECPQRYTLATDYLRSDPTKDGYGVLRGAAAVGTPAVIIEHSFHTNLRASLWLSDKAHLAAMARKTAQTIAEYFGIEEKPVSGDVDGDGDIDGVDYAMVKRAVLGNYELTPEQAERADVNGNGEVDNVDYAMIKRAALGTYDIDKNKKKKETKNEQ